MPYTPARLPPTSLSPKPHKPLPPESPRHFNPLHKTQRPRIQNTRAPQPSTSAALRAALAWSAEKEDLMIACAQGDASKVDALLSVCHTRNPDLIRDSKLRTPLLVACAGGKADVTRLLVRRGADVNNPVGDVMGNRPLDLAVISNNVDCVLALLEAGAQIPPFDPSPPYTSAAPRPRRKRTPLDLAQSRLDMLIRARVEERRVSSDEDDEMDVEEPGISAKEDDIMGQVIKIIRLLKHFIRAPTPTMSISSTPHASATDPFSELDALTDQLSRIQLRASSSAQEVAGKAMAMEQEEKENENENEVGVLRRLKEVVEGLQI